jgi:protein TonB
MFFVVLLLSCGGPRIPRHYQRPGSLNAVSAAYCEDLESNSWRSAKYMDRYSCVMKYGRLGDLDAALDFDCNLRRRMDEESSFEPPSDWVIPITRSEPTYPAQAENDRIRGYVEISFDIDDHGAPTNIQVTKSVPAGIFDNAAVNSFSKWRYCQRAKRENQVRLKFDIR